MVVMGNGASEPVRFLGEAGVYRLVPHSSAQLPVRALLAEVEEGVSMKRVFVKFANAPEGCETIQQELTTLQALGTPGHPLIVKLVDRGMREHLPWFALEWAGEVSLWDWNSQRSVHTHGTSQLVLEMVRKLANALAYVHSRGIVHCDLTPRNIVLKGLEPTLIDFGSAAPSGERRQRTVSHDQWRGTGTAGYVAPERLLGHSWDSRADLYSLGCIWFELMFGRPVFQASDADGLYQQHTGRKAPSIGALAPELPAELGLLLGEMLAKDPHVRPATAGIVARKIEEVLGLLPTNAADEGIPLFESRLFGRSESWSRLTRQIEQASEGKGGCTMVLGDAGTGRSRLLEEAVRHAEKVGLEVVHLTSGEPHQVTPERCSAAFSVPYRKLGRLVVLDDAEDCLELGTAWQALEQSPCRSGILMVASATSSAWQRLGAELPAALNMQTIELLPLSRDASRRVVTDLLGGRAGEQLQRDLWRQCHGVPSLLHTALKALKDRREIAQASDNSWNYAQETDPDSATRRRVQSSVPPFYQPSVPGETNAPPDHATLGEHHSRLGNARKASLHFRAAAAQAARTHKTPWARVAHLLESAMSELKLLSHSDKNCERAMLRVGYRLLKVVSKGADHNSVHALSRELTEMTRRMPLLEARIRRLDALSYRIEGQSADALFQLEVALGCLDRVRGVAPEVVARERVNNRLGASWAYYSDHAAAEAFTAAASVRFIVREVGTTVQRAETLLHLAKALALQQRYRYSERVIRLERKAVALYSKRRASPSALVSAESNLAFMLLFGGMEQCQESVEIFERIFGLAKKANEITALTRVTTYLAFGHRRLRNVEECERQAQMTLEYSHECGQMGYVGAGRACLGWVALRRGDVNSARVECEAAVDLWQRRRAVDSSRKSEYPFQWLALFPLLSLDAATENPTNSAKWIDDLTHPTQARLAPPVQRALQQARKGGAPEEGTAERLVRVAAEHGYL